MVHSTCPICQSAAVLEVGFSYCRTCGAKIAYPTADRLKTMSPESRAAFIGSYHATTAGVYGWFLPPMSRSEKRAYAKGFLHAPSPTPLAVIERDKRRREIRRDASILPW